MPKTVRLAAWNLNHRTGRKPVPVEVAEALKAIDADVVVLTEYVDGEHQAEFKKALRKARFESLAVSVAGPKQNQVLIAARTAMVDEDLLPLPGYTEAAATNWLHRKLPDYDLEIVGMRAPAYELQRDKKAYWSQVGSILQSAADRPIVFIGDVNCDPFSDNSPGSQALLALAEHGYQLSNPDGECSYFGPSGARTRIDHVLASRTVRLEETLYRTEAGGLTLAGPGGGTALSDHAVLFVSASLCRGD